MTTIVLCILNEIEILRGENKRMKKNRIMRMRESLFPTYRPLALKFVPLLGGEGKGRL